MDRLKQLLSLTLLIFVQPFGIAQKSTAPANRLNIEASANESIFIHANATTFLIGETIYCKLYCLNPANRKSSEISKIAYVELIDATKKSVFKHKLPLENGVAQADFFIPTTLQTGNYKLIAYTRWMLSASSVNFFEMDVILINPFQPLKKEPTLQNRTATTTSDVSTNQSDQIAVEIKKRTFTNREKVTVTIRNTSGVSKGNYSLSIRKLDALPVIKQANRYNSENGISLATKKTSLPEIRGEIISGTLKAKKGNIDLSNKTVALSIPGKSFAFKIATTNRLGKFNFILDKYPIASAAVVQVFENNREEYIIQLDESISPDLSQLKFSENLVLLPEHKLAIEERSVANQIENAYYDRKKDSLRPENPSPSFFHPLEKRYVLDDYTRFPTFKETITEVILEMYSVKKANKYSIHLRNTDLDPEVYGPPLILVDGILIQDTNELYDYNMENMYAVDLINQPYIYGPKTFSGVANFITKNTDYENQSSGDFIKKVDLQRPLIRKKYYSPNYDSKNTNKRIPDYRQQLLWYPELNMAQGENEISFYTSDLTGTFEIVLEGFTNSGIPISAKKYFEVR